MKLNKSLLSVHQYSLDGEVSGSDYVIGEDANSGFETKNFTFNQISIEVWGTGEAGQVLTATGDGRYVWTDDASESDIPATTTSTTAAPTTTTTTSASSATTTTTTTTTSAPDTNFPDICLSSYNPVTFSTINGVNSYVFSGTYGSYKVTVGTYTLTGVPSTHPIAILNSGKTSSISYTGTTNGGSKTASDGQTYAYYYGDITITVNYDFGTVSYECYNHGYMGGQNNLSYDASCAQPVTTTTTSAPTTTTTTEAPTTTTTTEFINPIDGQCYKNDPAFNGEGDGPAMLSYFLTDGTEEFLSYQTMPVFQNLKAGDKIIRFGFCHTVACLYPTTPKSGGKFLSIITSGGSYGYSSTQNYPSGFCVDPDPDNVTTTTTTTQAPTTTTTTPAPTTTTTTQDPFVLPATCGYALWRGNSNKQVGTQYKTPSLNVCHFSYWPVHPSNGDNHYILFKPVYYTCIDWNNYDNSNLNFEDIVIFNFYNVNNTKIGLDYYYKCVGDEPYYDAGRVPPKNGELMVGRPYEGTGNLFGGKYIFGAQDLLGNDPIKDLGYYSTPSELNGNIVRLFNLTFLARHTNAGGTNECSITLPSSLNTTTTTTTTAPTTTTTTSAATTTTTTSGQASLSITNVNVSSVNYYGSNTDPSLYISWSSATITTNGISSWSNVPQNGCNNPNSSEKEFNATFNVGGTSYGPYVARYSTAYSNLGNISSFNYQTFMTGQSSSSDPTTLTEIQFSHKLGDVRCSTLADLSTIFSNFTTNDTFTLEYIPLT